MRDIGRAYDALGQGEKALGQFDRALTIWKELSDHRNESTTLNNIGAAYDRFGQNEKALEFYNKALETQRALGDRSGEATTLNNIGVVQNRLGNRKLALQYYEQALPLLKETDNREAYSATLENLSEVYEALGDKQKANQLHAQALAIENRVAGQPTLYIVAIGIDQYGLSLPRLGRRLGTRFSQRTAAADAKNLTDAFSLVSQGLYGRIDKNLLLNSSRRQILRALDHVVKQAKPEDTVIVYCSGLAFTASSGAGSKQQAFLMPSDFNPDLKFDTALSTSFLHSTFSKIAARRRLIIWDTSRGSDGFQFLTKSFTNENEFLEGILQRDVAYVALSDEPVPNSHGILATALLKGLVRSKDGRETTLSARELINYAQTYVANSRTPSASGGTAKSIKLISYVAGQDFQLAVDNSGKRAHTQSGTPFQMALISPLVDPQRQSERVPGKVIAGADTAISRSPRARTGKDYALLIATNVYDHWPSFQTLKQSRTS